MGSIRREGRALRDNASEDARRQSRPLRFAGNPATHELQLLETAGAPGTTPYVMNKTNSNDYYYK